MKTESALAKAERVEAWMKGKAPMIDKENYKISLIRVFNYHNEFTENKELKKIAVNHYKNNPALATTLNLATEEETRQIGILVQYVEALQEKDVIKLNNMVDAIHKKYSIAKRIEAPAKVIPIKRALNAVEVEATKVAEKIESEIDDLFTLKSDGKFDPVVYLTNAKLTAATSNKLMEYFVEPYNELVSVIEGNDEQLNEAYSCYPKPRIKRILNGFMLPMWEYLEKIHKVKKAERKPRKRKEKPAAVLVKSVQYLKEEGKLKSIEPKQIIGASQVFLYNVKYKKLTHLVSTDAKGLTIKGTTVYGFNPDESMTKVVRKPDLVLADVSKRKLKFHMKQMKTTAQEANGRINSDTIILTV